MRLACCGSRPRCQHIAIEQLDDLPVRGGIETDRNSASGSVSNHWISR